MTSISTVKKHFQKQNQTEFRKRYLYYGATIICAIIVGFLLFNMNSQNNHINNWLVNQKVRTERVSKHQHLKFLDDQSKLDAIANFHEIYNNYYLEQHPNVKNYHKLLKSSSYMKMTNHTAKLNNHFNNQMANLKNKELTEQKQLPHEYRHQIYGNVANTLNIHQFNHMQDKLKNDVVSIFFVALIGFCFFISGLSYKKRTLDAESKQLDNESKQLRINQIKTQQQHDIKEFGDSDPE